MIRWRRISLLVAPALLIACSASLPSPAGSAQKSPIPPALRVTVPEPERGADPAGAEALLKAAEPRLASAEAVDYLAAIEKELRPAVAKDPGNLRARALLASAYLRILGDTRRDAETFGSLAKLLAAPARDQVPVEYVTARAEFLLILGRDEEARRLLEATLQKVRTPEVLFQYGRALLAQRQTEEGLRQLALAQAAQPSPRYSSGYEEARRKFPPVARASSAPEASPASGADPSGQDAAGAADHAANPALLRQLEEAQRLSGTDPNRGLFLFQRAAEANRSNAFPYVFAGELLEKLGRYHEAIDRFERALATNGAPPRASHGLARIYLKQYDSEKAAAALAGLPPTDPYAEYLLGLAVAQRERRADASAEHFAKALALGAHFPQIFDALGQQASESKDEPLAEFFFAMALREDAHDAKASLGLALARFHLDSPARAIAFLRNQLAQHPRFAEFSPFLQLDQPVEVWSKPELGDLTGVSAILTNIAMVYLRAGDQVMGKTYLLNAIRLDGKNPEPFRLLGDLTREEGSRTNDYNAKRHSYRYALASYEMQSTFAPDDPDAYKATADLYFDIRDLGAASGNYHKVLELTPRYPDVHLRLAQIARNGGDVERAQALLHEELAVNPGSDLAHVELGNIFMSQHGFTDAKSEFEAARRCNDANSDAAFGLGVIAHLEGDFDKAVPLFHRTIELDPHKVDAFWQLGLIHQKQGKKLLAAQAFANFKSYVHDPHAIAAADAKLKDLGGLFPGADPDHLGPGSTQLPGEPPLFSRVREGVGRLLKAGFGVGRAAGGSSEFFSNQFVEFKLPEGWACQLENISWICQPTDPAKRQEAFALVQARISQPGLDELSVYKAHLEKPRRYESLSGESITSVPKFVKERDLAGHPWIDSLHLDSDAPDFFTRYLATRDADLGLVVTFHVRKDKYEKYGPEMDALVKSLHAFREPGSVNDRGSPAAEEASLLQARVVVHASYESLEPAAQAVVESHYGKVLGAFGRKDFPAMHAELVALFSDVENYKDAKFYDNIARRELRALEEERRVAENESRRAALRAETEKLVEQGRELLGRVRRHPLLWPALDSLMAEITARDPNNYEVTAWKDKLQDWSKGSNRQLSSQRR